MVLTFPDHCCNIFCNDLENMSKKESKTMLKNVSINSGMCCGNYRDKKKNVNLKINIFSEFYVTVHDW